MKYDIRSRIFLTDSVENTMRKFGEASGYINVMVVCRSGQRVPAMLTWHDLGKAITRAQKNPEDLPLKKGFWVMLMELCRRWK